MLFALIPHAMINPEEFTRVLPEYYPALQVALDKHAEAQAKMADFKKKYTSVKNKVKRLEKDMAAMDEAKEGSYIRHMGYDIELAIKKFVLIDKKLKRFKNERERYSNKALRTLRSPKGFDPYQTRWHMDHVGGMLSATDQLLREVLDMLRIAKGHLAKVDATKKLVAKNRVNQIYYAAMRERNEELKRKQAEEALIASAQEQDSQPTAENTEGASKRSWWEKLLRR